jgi:hypothetical protein
MRDVPALLLFVVENGVGMFQSIRFHRLSLPSVRPLIILVILFSAFGLPALGTEIARSCEMESLLLESGEGLLIHATGYRPGEPATRAVILAADDDALEDSCWGTLPQEFCQRGYEVLVAGKTGADAGETRQVRSGIDHPRGPLEDFDRVTLMGVFGDSVTSITLVCVGRAGWAAGPLMAAEGRIDQVAWISPRGDAEGERTGGFAGGAPVRMLLVSSEEETESSTLAGDLFSEFNTQAELRLISRGQGGCRLLSRRRVGAGLIEWVAAESRTGSSGSR